jgi:hypothetical protein
MGYVLFNILYVEVVTVLSRNCLKWKNVQVPWDGRWQLTKHSIFRTIPMHSPRTLQGIMEPLLHISQFKDFFDSAMTFSGRKSIISLLNYFQLRFPSGQGM